MSSVPGADELVSNARESRNLLAYLGGGAGGTVMALIYLFLAPLREAAAEFGEFIGNFIEAAGGLFTGGILGNLSFLLNRGAEGSGQFLASEELGFVLAVVLVLMAAGIFRLWQQATDSDFPFLGDVIPFWGGGEE